MEMPPQIDQTFLGSPRPEAPFPGKNKIVWAAVAALVIAVLVLVWFFQKQGEEAPEPLGADGLSAAEREELTEKMAVSPDAKPLSAKETADLMARMAIGE